MVEHSTQNPKIVGSNPATDPGKVKNFNEERKNVSVLWVEVELPKRIAIVIFEISSFVISSTITFCTILNDWQTMENDVFS